MGSWTGGWSNSFAHLPRKVQSRGDDTITAMTRNSPLSNFHEQAGALIRPYGPPDSPVPVVEAYDVIEAEYAALRKSAIMLDQPQRGTIEIRGGDRIAFLNRMLTQELKGLEAFQVRRSFWLNRKGRIDADMRLIELPDRMLIDLDVFSILAGGERQSAIDTLSAFVFSEDVQITDQSEAWHRLALHGPGAIALLARLSRPFAGPAILEIQPGQATIVSIEGHDVIVDRQDSLGEIGLELLMKTSEAAEIYELLSAPPDTHARDQGEGWKPDPRNLARRVGWHAFNIARIEAGTPLFFIDFGPTSLPHESGVLKDRVSFKKGCYLGQEVVARMESLGHPKQRLVALKLENGVKDANREAPPQPVTGCAVLFETPGVAAIEGAPAAESKREVVGAVTSSVLAPMLSGTPICFAMVKYKHTTPGTKLHVEIEEGSPATLVGTVQESLVFWHR